MSTPSSIALGPERRPGLFAAMALRPLAVAFVVTALVTFLRLTDTVDSDVAWQLWIANRLHAGASLYNDIIETNPPLWFWMALPVDRIAGLFDVRSEAVLVLAIGGLVAISLAATDRLIRHIPAGRRTLLLAYASLILMAMPWVHLGQREQIVLVATIPYTALVAARREGHQVPALFAALIGIGAALGFALKHYFLIAPALLELWLLTGSRRNWRPVRPETIAIVAVGAAYALALILLERDFLTNIVPLIRLAYDGYGAPSLRYLFGPFALAGLLTLGLLISQIRRLAGRKAPLAAALLVSASGYGLIYFIQSKGWPYHAIPLIGCGSLALATLLAEMPAEARVLRIIAPAFLTLPLAVAVNEQRHPVLPSPDLKSAVSGLRAGDSVGFLTVETAIPWSVTLQGGYRYASRYNGFWMMQAVVTNERLGNHEPRLAALGRQIVSNTIADFSCTPPRRIIVSGAIPGGVDILAFFLRDPQFAALFSHYRLRSRSSLETYELISPLPRPTQKCRSGI